MRLYFTHRDVEYVTLYSRELLGSQPVSKDGVEPSENTLLDVVPAADLLIWQPLGYSKPCYRSESAMS